MLANRSQGGGKGRGKSAERPEKAGRRKAGKAGKAGKIDLAPLSVILQAIA
jgi:hypothetical protein